MQASAYRRGDADSASAPQAQVDAVSYGILLNVVDLWFFDHQMKTNLDWSLTTGLGLSTG
jgi:hypothetical protein